MKAGQNTLRPRKDHFSRCDAAFKAIFIAVCYQPAPIGAALPTSNATHPPLASRSTHRDFRRFCRQMANRKRLHSRILAASVVTELVGLFRTRRYSIPARDISNGLFRPTQSIPEHSFTGITKR
jgi:hypothetical protein